MAGKLTQQDFGIPEVRQGMRDLTSDINKSVNSIKNLVSESSKLSKGGIAKSSKEAADNLKKAAKATKHVTEEQKVLAASMQEIEKLRKQNIQTQAKINTVNKENTKALRKRKVQLQETNKVLKQKDIIENKNAGTLEKLAAKNQLLLNKRKKLNLETKTGRKQLSLINKQLDRNNKVIGKNSDGLTKQRMNVGNYGNTMGQVFGGMPPMIARIGMAFKALGTMMLTNPIGIIIAAIAVAVGSIVVAFKRFTPFADKATVAIAGMKGAANVLLDRFGKLGVALTKLLDGDFKGAIAEMKKEFEGVNEELEKEIALSEELKQQQIELEYAAKARTLQQAKFTADLRALQTISKDQTKTDEERLAALDKAGRMQKKNAADEIKIKKQELLQVAELLQSDSMQVGEKQKLLSLVEGIKNGTIDRVEAEEISRQITMSDKDARGSLNAIIEKAVEIEEARANQTKVTNKIIAERTALVTKLATKEASASKLEATNALASANNTRNSFEERAKFLDEYVLKTEESAKKRLNANIITEEQYTAEVAAAGEKRLDAEAKIANEQQKIRDEGVLKGIESQKQLQAGEEITILESYNKQLASLNLMVSKKEKTEEEAVAERIRLEEKLADDLLILQIQRLEDEIANIEDDNVKKLELLQQLADAKKQINKEEIEDDKLTGEQKIEITKRVVRDLQAAFQNLAVMQSNLEQGRINDINAQRDQQLEKVKGNKDAEGRINQQADDKIRQIEEERAEREKKIAIAQATIDFLSGIVSIWSKWGGNLPVAIALTAGLSAVYLTNLAKIKSTPAFKDGVQNFDGGYAVVGDGGESEMVVSGSNSFMTPDTPTLMNLPKGTDVYNQKQMKALGYTDMVNHNLLNRMNPIIDERSDLARTLGEVRRMNANIQKGNSNNTDTLQAAKLQAIINNTNNLEDIGMYIKKTSDALGG